jgi:cytochrome c biogenesis protein CcdA
MIESLQDTLVRVAESNPYLAPAAVFLGGMLTASNPCVLAMVPLMIGFVGGSRTATSWSRALALSAVFVLGLSVTFSIMGLVASLGGKLLGDIGGYWKYLVGGIAVLMGLHLADIVRVPIPVPKIGTPEKRGFIGAFFLGMLFGVVSAPCAVPILALLLAWIALKGTSTLYGSFLLIIYALGHSVLILIAGTSMGAARHLVEEGRLARATGILRKGSGALIVLVGLYFIFFQ